MILRIPRYLAVVALFLLSHTATGEEVETRQFSLPDQGSLRLDVPKSWRSEVSRRITPPALNFQFTSPHTPTFQVLMTVFRVQSASSTGPDSVELKKIVAQSAERIKAGAVESEIPIRALQGPSAVGYYFSATDKAPKPGEYKYMTQGLARFGPLMASFTVFKNEGDESVPGATIAMVRSGAYNDTGARTPNPVSLRRARPDVIRITRQRNDYVLSVPVSRLVLTLPRGNLSQKTGVNDHPRYFYFEDSAESLTISGWFEPAEKFTNIRKLWADETKSWRRGNLPAPRNIAFAKVGRWQAIFYDIAMANATKQKHLRAHWVQDGTWIDIHLSTASNRSRKDVRARLTALLRNIAVTRKK